jgi:hypothetical protein
MQKKIRLNWSNVDPQKIKHLANGGIQLEGVVIRTGIFKYETDLGGMQSEYLPEEELFNEETIKTLEGSAVTNEHPDDMISPHNWKNNSVGFVSNPRREGNFLVADLTIVDKQTILEIIEGEKKELSAGYWTDTVPSAGVTESGEEYQFIQKNVIFNHCAVVRMGRGGPQVSLRLNSAGNVETKLFNEKSGLNEMKQAKLNEIREEEDKFCVYSEDGEHISCHETREEAEAQLAAIEANKENMEEESEEKDDSRLEELLAILEMGVDEFFEKANEMSDELKKLMSYSKEEDEEKENESDEDKEKDEKENSLRFNEAVKREAKQLVDLYISAKQLGVEVSGNETREELQLQIVQTTKPKMNLKGKSPEYIQALLDDALSGVSVDHFWKSSSTASETLNSLEEVVRGKKHNSRDEDTESVEDKAARIHFLRARNLV